MRANSTASLPASPLQQGLLFGEALEGALTKGTNSLTDILYAIADDDPVDLADATNLARAL